MKPARREGRESRGSRGETRPDSLTGLEDFSHVEVVGLDAIDGTPVVDLKPVMREFLPRESIRQPQWSVYLMRDYWKR